MEILRHLDDRSLSSLGSVATLGNFDGLHLGHQALVRSAVEDARRLSVPSVVLTFEPHPLKVLAPSRAPKLLLSHKDKMELLQSFDIDIVAIQKFDAAFARVPARDFVTRVLVKRLGIKKIWVGRDLRFGQGREGSVNDLLQWGSKDGFDVGIVEPILLGGIRISSSVVRRLVEEGRVDEAAPMLGRCHFVSGRVVAGQRRGRDLGFPTANISSRTEVLPLDGIYATLFQFGAKRYLSASSIGTNPTFGDGPRTVESFVLDFDGDLYGEPVKLYFVKRIRAEKKFASVDDLVAQIHQDVARARVIFAESGLRAGGAG
ncbi:MAG TPA: bifunctional riboflavin kinase/FAD synthetase [Candidatus Binatia bacterium]|nr:bifunctional riboflavin kinase/FAD synthetase [Candidatus Binatia bacterium]